jgi:hypothetical protein
MARPDLLAVERDAAVLDANLLAAGLELDLAVGHFLAVDEHLAVLDANLGLADPDDLLVLLAELSGSASGAG